MASTAQFALPLVAPAQAQKHVTVNEALVRLDAAAQLRVVSSVTQVPPGSAVDGTSYLVPSDSSGDWQGKSGQIAVWSNGGWIYLEPRPGWRAWDESRNGPQMYDGSNWLADAVAVSPNGAAMLWTVVEFDHVVTPGTSNITSTKIPSQAQVIGVTGRVLDKIVGAPLTGWRIGVAGSDNRYGSGLSVEQNSYLVGLSGSPVTYYTETPLLLTGEGGNFLSGNIRLALNLILLAPSREV